MGAALALDEAGLAQLGDQVLEIGEGKVLALGDRAQRDGPVAGLAAELDHQADSVLGSCGEEHRPKSYSDRSDWPRVSDHVAHRVAERRRRSCAPTASAWRRSMPATISSATRDRVEPALGRDDQLRAPVRRVGACARRSPSSSSSSTSRPTTCLWRPARRASSVALTPSSSRYARTAPWRGRRSSVPALREAVEQLLLGGRGEPARRGPPRSGVHCCRSPRRLVVVTIKTVTNRDCTES